jgi:sn-glycerol 3-phosphate transport system substrate-binding protein
MRKLLGTLLFGLLLSVSWAKPIKIYLWHSLVGPQGNAFSHLVKGFNQSQSQYQVIPLYKGDYNETLTMLIAAFRAGEQPAVAQVFDVGTAIMMSSKGAIIPVYQLMNDNGYHFSSKEFLPAIASYYSNSKGQLMSLPFNSSSPVLYYNKNAFKKAGLNPNKPPKTWQQVAKDGKALLKAGYPCAFTTTWPAWIQLEEFSVWHDLPFASNENGYTGYHTKVLYDNYDVIQHVKQLANWEKSGLFEYGGRGDSAQSLFISQHCAMYTQSSGSRTAVKSESQFPVGIGELPYTTTIYDVPQNTIVGGASFWVMSGLPKAVYKGVAAFFNYLLETKNQEYWQAKSGYLPLTKAAFKAAEKSGYYKKNPGALVAIKELTNKAPTEYSRGIRLGFFPQIRDINDGALEAVFSGEKRAKPALQEAAKRSNELLKQFAEAVDPRDE